MSKRTQPGGLGPRRRRGRWICGDGPAVAWRRWVMNASRVVPPSGKSGVCPRDTVGRPGVGAIDREVLVLAASCQTPDSLHGAAGSRVKTAARTDRRDPRELVVEVFGIDTHWAFVVVRMSASIPFQSGVDDFSYYWSATRCIPFGECRQASTSASALEQRNTQGRQV